MLFTWCDCCSLFRSPITAQRLKIHHQGHEEHEAEVLRGHKRKKRGGWHRVLDHQGVSEMAGHGVLVICPQLMKSAQCQSVVPSPLETHTGIASGTLPFMSVETLLRLTVLPCRGHVFYMRSGYTIVMSTGHRKMRRIYDHDGDSHFLMFSCFRRHPLLSRHRTCLWIVKAEWSSAETRGTGSEFAISTDRDSIPMLTNHDDHISSKLLD
jgi:hypothetical protein